MDDIELTRFTRQFKVAYFFTTFPKPSETFFQREIRSLLTLGLRPEIHSIYGGARSFENYPIQQFGWVEGLAFPLWLIYWGFKKPKTVLATLYDLLRHPATSWLNFQEIWLGALFGLCRSKHLSNKNFKWIHGVWATMPTTAAWVAHRLSGIPYSMEAHAYDIFQHGGDGLIRQKLKESAFVRTSTQTGAKRLSELGASESKIRIIYRGIPTSPQPPALKTLPTEGQLRFLSIGRFVGKKGFFHLLELLSYFKSQKLDFTATIAGDGPLRDQLIQYRDRLQLQEEVSFPGFLSQDVLKQEFKAADFFLFTGRIADDGDRDGLPNVLLESVECGLPIFTTPVGAVLELIQDRETGRVFHIEERQAWLEAIYGYQESEKEYQHLQKEAFLKLSKDFSLESNMQSLLSVFFKYYENMRT